MPSLEDYPPAEGRGRGNKQNGMLMVEGLGTLKKHKVLIESHTVLAPRPPTTHQSNLSLSNQCTSFSSIIRNGTPKLKGGSWDHKEQERSERARVKALEVSLKAETEAKRVAEKERLIEQRKRRAEAALKNSAVQTIKDANKIKRMSKKQLKNIKKSVINNDGTISYESIY